MTNLKNHKAYGFTLIEVLVALSIASIVLTPILVMYGTALRGVGFYVQRLQRMIYAQKFLNELEKQKLLQQRDSANQEKDVDDPEMKLIVVRKNISETSSLHAVHSLQRHVITMQWDDTSEQLVWFTYNQDDKKEKKGIS